MFALRKLTAIILNFNYGLKVFCLVEKVSYLLLFGSMAELVDATDFDKTNLENLKDSQSLTLKKFILFDRLDDFRYICLTMIRVKYTRELFVAV